jgi:predicted lipid-binding transport protein (Tim44 family)
LLVVGWKLGRALGGRGAGSRPHGNRAPQARPLTSVPPEDLIFSPGEVADKARETTLLLEALAQHEPVFAPQALGEFILRTFTRVQECWAGRDYGSLREWLSPALWAKHEALLQAMRRHREINRIEDLRVRRLAFVRVTRPDDPDLHEVTALITFEARVYFVHEQTEAYVRGSQRTRLFQEFWTFRRRGDVWLLHAIEQGDESDRLELSNTVTGREAVDLCNAEAGGRAL